MIWVLVIVCLITLAVCIRYIIMIARMALSVWAVQRGHGARPVPTHASGKRFVWRP